MVTSLSGGHTDGFTAALTSTRCSGVRVLSPVYTMLGLQALVTAGALLADNFCGDLFQFGEHLLFAGGHYKHDNPVSSGVLVLLDHIGLGSDGHGHDLDRSRIALEFRRELVKHCSAVADLLRRIEPRHPAVAVRHDAPKHIPGRHRAHVDWRVRLLQRLWERDHRWKIIVLAVELSLVLCPQLLHGKDSLTGLAPAMIVIAAHNLSFFPNT